MLWRFLSIVRFLMTLVMFFNSRNDPKPAEAQPRPNIPVPGSEPFPSSPLTQSSCLMTPNEANAQLGLSSDWLGNLSGIANMTGPSEVDFSSSPLIELPAGFDQLMDQPADLSKIFTNLTINQALDQLPPLHDSQFGGPTDDLFSLDDLFDCL